VKSLILILLSQMIESYFKVIWYPLPLPFVTSSGFLDTNSLYILLVGDLLLPILSASSVESMVHNFNHPSVNNLTLFAIYLDNLQTSMNSTKWLFLFWVSWILLEKTIQVCFFKLEFLSIMSLFLCTAWELYYAFIVKSFSIPYNNYFNSQNHFFLLCI
jgi:hypothetical protein